MSAQVSDFAEEKELFEALWNLQTERKELTSDGSKSDMARLLTVTKLKRSRKGKVWELGC